MNLTDFEYILEDIDIIECCGMFEDEYVYDIEIDEEDNEEDTHTFFGGDILVHNSLYVSYTPVMESLGYDGDPLKFILTFDGMFVKYLFKDLLDKYAERYGVKNLHDFELETINMSGLHIQKKHYINNVVYEDGMFYEPLTHFISKGVEIVKSSTPVFVRENIWEFIKYLFDNPIKPNIKDILKILKDLKKRFMLANIEEISMTSSCTKYEEKVIDDQNGVECVKAAHFGVKAAALHNYLLNINSQYKTRYDLIRGGRIKYYYCKHPLGEKFAYLRSFHPIEITTKEGLVVDYDKQFEKTFLSIANRFIEPMGLPPISKRISVLNNIFGGLPDVEELEEVDNDVNDEFDDMWY